MKLVAQQRRLFKHNSQVQSCGKQFISPCPSTKDLLQWLGRGKSNDIGLSKSLPFIKAGEVHVICIFGSYGVSTERLLFCEEQ